MTGQFRPPIPGQQGHHALRQMLHPGNQGADEAVAVLAGDLDQHHKARPAFDQRRDMAVSGTTQKVTLPVARNGAILDLCRAVTDRYGIDDLTPRLPRSRRGSPPAHDPAAAQMGEQLLLENAHIFKSGCLNEQAFIDRLV